MNSSVTSQRWLQFITSHQAHLWKVVLRQEGLHYLPELNLHQVCKPKVSVRSSSSTSSFRWLCDWVVRVLDFKSSVSKYKSCSHHPLDLFQFVPGWTPWLYLYWANWSASCLLGFLISSGMFLCYSEKPQRGVVNEVWRNNNNIVIFILLFSQTNRGLWQRAYFS